MARIDNLTNFLTDVADAIRGKKGTTGAIQASSFDTEIESISSGIGMDYGLIFNEIDTSGYPTIVTTVGLTTFPSGFFRLANTSTGCFKNTQKIILNKEITTIGDSSFRNCGNLTEIIINSETVCQLQNVNAFNGTKYDSGLGYIYVQDNLVSSYKSATNWSNYASQIKGISELGG